jgi:bacillithiol system protein YtxJ
MIELRETGDWIALKAKCLEQKKNLFLAKLSPACPVSHMAEKVLLEWLPTHPQSTFIAARIDVIRARNLSRSIAEEVGVKHESPQVILLSPESKNLWDVDHFEINTDNLNQQFPQ